MKKPLRYLSLFAAAVLAVSTSQVQAQIIGYMTAKIPFPFYVGNSKLPPGTYSIHNVDPNDNGLMEIQNADDTTSALFVVVQARTDNPPTHGGVLRFKHLRNRYYLRQLFDPDDKYGATAVDVGYSKMMKAVSETGGEVKDIPTTHQRKPLTP